MRFLAIIAALPLLSSTFILGNSNAYCPDYKCYEDNSNRLARQITVTYGELNVTTHIQLYGETVPLGDLQPPLIEEGATQVTLLYSDHFFELDGTPISNDDTRVVNEKKSLDKEESDLNTNVVCVIEKDIEEKKTALGEFEYPESTEPKITSMGIPEGFDLTSISCRFEYIDWPGFWKYLKNERNSARGV